MKCDFKQRGNKRRKGVIEQYKQNKNLNISKFIIYSSFKVYAV